MDREILFKAKCIDTGKWIEGDLIQSTLGLCYIKEKTEDGTAPNRQVNLVTVGQYIGLKDKNGAQVFSGDKFNDPDEECEYLVIEWNQRECKFCIASYGYDIYFNEGGGEGISKTFQLLDKEIFEVSFVDTMEIIGNIHDKVKT